MLYTQPLIPGMALIAYRYSTSVLLPAEGGPLYLLLSGSTVASKWGGRLLFGIPMMDLGENVTSWKSLRAQRFAIRFDVRYRPEGQEEWYEGQVENVSQSGVLFETVHVIAVNTPIEFKFVLPTMRPDELSAEVICSGEVVRVVPTSSDRKTPAVAAKITAYRFQRPILDACAEKGDSCN